MQKIDRLGWAAALVFRAYGVRLSVRVNDLSAIPLLLERLPPGWKPASAPVVERLYSLFVGGTNGRAVRRFHLLYGDINRIARTIDLEEALDAFESDLHLYVAEAAHRRVFIHAGVVGWRGQAIVIPGRSYTGKTTLVAELLRRGATYYSDEYAVVDERGRVHPYPRPLQIREGEMSKQKKYRVEEFGGRSGRRPLPVGLVVISRYKHAARWRPRSLSTGQGVLELLANTISARRKPAVVLASLHQALMDVPVIKGARGEAAEMAEAILAEIEG
jgi:hypothetical protein